jgi:hypothetical protein
MGNVFVVSSFALFVKKSSAINEYGNAKGAKLYAKAAKAI